LLGVGRRPPRAVGARRASSCLVLVLLGFWLFPAGVAADGVTMANNDLRTGWYGDQPGLSPAKVGGSTFGKLFTASVVGQVYAQPLVSAGVLLVVTEANHVYGLDPETGVAKWSRSLGTPWNASDLGCADLLPTIGVTGTPVIDASGTAYFLAKTYASGSSGPGAWDMHAVDVQTGWRRAVFRCGSRGRPRTIRA
jgi:outer membrane protein assembly factor BamB